MTSHPLEQARKTLETIEIRGSVSGRRPKFFYVQLLDAFRIASDLCTLAEKGVTAQIFTAESIEVLLRRIVEQTILACYVHNEKGTEVIDRFLKTSAMQFRKSWNEQCHTEDANLEIKQLPDYKLMSEVSPFLYDLYGKLSYLAHPRSALPYSVVERENRDARGIDSRDFFLRRTEHALFDLHRCLDMMTNIFQLEDQAYINMKAS